MTWTPPKPAIVNTEECELYYTLEQLLAVRNEALEEAAKKCDELCRRYHRMEDAAERVAAKWCADAIRAMKEQTK